MKSISWYICAEMKEILTALMIPLAGTVVGAGFVFCLKKEISAWMQKLMLGFASGVMVAASVWSLLIPSITIGNVWHATVGLLCGFGFLLLIDYITPHIHSSGDAEGPKSRLSRTSKLMLAVTIHNLPEGMAVGATLVGAITAGAEISMAAAFAVSIGIAIQNIPEGAIISVPMKAEGNSRSKSFLLGCLSGVVEPVGGALVIVLASVFTPMMPYLLAFAAGAMLYVVVEELIPETSKGSHSNLGTVGFAVGFALMMVLDVVLG